VPLKKTVRQWCIVLQRLESLSTSMSNKSETQLDTMARNTDSSI